MKKYKLHLSFTMQILIALVLAIIVGALMTNEVTFANTYIKPIGTIFLNMLKFIVVPLVLISIMTGIMSMDDVSKIGRLSIRTLILFAITTIIAICLGLGVGTMLQGIFPKIPIAITDNSEVVEMGVMEQIVNFVPNNIMAPLLHDNMMQVIVIAVVFAIAIIQIGAKGKLIRDMVLSLNEVVIKVLGYIMAVAPIGVFCMLTPVIASNGIEVLGAYATLICADYFCFILQAGVVYSLLVYFMGRCNPWHFYRKMTPAIMFAFSSSSGIATLPYTMQSCEELGVKKNIGSFVLSLGATIHMDGVAIYLGVTAMFVAACCGIDLTTQQYIAIALSSTIASIGTPGIPGGSLALMAMVFNSAGLPVEGVAIAAGIDRLVDMGRTVMSITGDAACAVALKNFDV